MANTAPKATHLVFGGEAHQVDAKPLKHRNRANQLDGATWTRYSISVWNDIRKNSAELAAGHPAMFPSMLVERLIDCFTRPEDCYVLDPFLGSGATLIAAQKRGKIGIGFEISPKFIAMAKSALRQGGLFDAKREALIFQDDARNVVRHVEPNSVDFCVTSPPYWDILNQKRTADSKPIRDYGDETNDLGKITSYESFLEELAAVFSAVLRVMKPGKYCVVNVMDLRKKARFYPFHSDLAARLTAAGWILDDIIVWDRRQEYNNLRPLGFPAVFRVNKVHEYLLIFQKPR
ncbi:MAG: site-specific DNA-methyltransferase [Acidobacteria bacterium]|nr:site-specific DNA-methyltransferase [Acidobacteriota bacterium]